MQTKLIASVLLIFGLAAPALCQNSQTATNTPRLIIRTDDIGFCHGVNLAFKRIADLRHGLLGLGHREHSLAR